MDPLKDSQSSEALENVKEIQLKTGVKRKRQCSQTPTDNIDEIETPPPHKKTTPCDNEVYGNDEIQRGESEVANDPLNSEEDVNHHDLEVSLFSLVHFCDEVLYEIFKFLDTWSLMTLMNVSKRFQKFVLDRRLWEEIDLSKEPLPLGILEDMLERSHEKTLIIKLRGPAPSQHIEGEIRHFNKTLRNSLTTRCTKLVALELYGVTLDFNQLSFQDFPNTLKRLVLNNCHVRVDANRSIFTAIETILVNLEELAIEQNCWFDPYYIMPIAKLPVLKYLSLKGCSQMEDFIPYGSIAGRHGFKQLEILNLCETPLNDSDLQCFNTVKTLREIYLQCPEEIKVENAMQNNKETNSTGSATKEDKSEDQTQEEKPTTSSSIKTDSELNTSPESQSSNSIKITPAVINGLLTTHNNDSASNLNENPSTSTQAINETNSNLEKQSSSENSTEPSTSATNSTEPSESNAESSQATNDTSNGNGNNSANVIAVSNTPPRSRILQRPDHIIYVDCRNRASPHAFRISLREPRMPLQRPQQQQQSPPPAFEQMMRHNLFWDIINPLGRGAAGPGAGAGGHPLFGEGNEQEHGLAGAANSHSNPFNIFYNPRPRGIISDRGVCSFGRTREPVHHGVIWIRFNNRPIENRFERFSIRDYKSVTDTSLEHLVLCSPHLVFLDVSGTSVTLKGIRIFKEQKPECKVVAEHLVSTVL